jgi:phosphinothricin acetyltransferase
MPSFRVRPATRADVPAILDIYNDAVLNTTASADYEPRSLQSRYDWFDEHKLDGYPIFVATNEAGEVVGWSSLSRYKERIGYRYTTENSIYIHPQWRGKGIGKLLMPPLIEGARTMGLHAIVAGISADNTASMNLHALFGFVEVAHYKETIYKFGQWLDVVYMEKLL